MRIWTVIAGIILLPAVAATTNAAALCAPPCGPIPAFVELHLEPVRNVTFADASELRLTGYVSYYVNVDQDGYYFDPQSPPVITFRVNRAPPWVQARFEPSQFTVPVADPQYVGQENGQTTELQFLWTSGLNVTLQRLRDPTVQELSRESPWIHRDGTYRITLSGSSTSSVLAPQVLGPTAGLQEGYGVRELFVVPEINGVAWRLDEQGALAPADGVWPDELRSKGSVPGVTVPLVVATLAALAIALRRRP